MLPMLFFSAILAAQVSHQQIIITEFPSAINVNVCKDMDVGTHLFNRVKWSTRSCECTSTNSFRALCTRTYPDPGARYQGHHDRLCDPRDGSVACVPTDDSRLLYPDCMCVRIPKKVGRKPSKDTDGIACSGGLTLGQTHQVSVFSTIVFAKGTSPSQVQGCYTQNSSNGVESSSNYPCNLGNNGHVIDFEPGQTYQACIEGNDDAPESISFQWIVTSSVGHFKRDGSQHDVTYDASMKQGKWKGSVVVVDEAGAELHRFEM